MNRLPNVGRRCSGRAVRYLLLKEGVALFNKFWSGPQMHQGREVKAWLKQTRRKLGSELATDLAKEGLRADATDVLRWFDSHLAAAWRAEG